MNVVLVYLRMYADVVANTAKAIVKSPWTMILPILLAIGFYFLALLLGPLGIVGGFAFNLAEAAGFSAYLYFVGEVVAKSTTSLLELKKSFGVYFWSVVSFRFVLWVASLFLGTALPNNQQSASMLNALWLVALIALNAVPETIYVKGTRGGVDTIMVSFAFLQEHLLHWLVPNGLILAFGWFAKDHIPYDLAGLLSSAVLLGALFHVAMVFRGTLYVALDGSTHRQRMFRYRKQ